MQIAASAKRYKIENVNSSQPSSLPRSEQDTMEEFLTFIKLLLGVLGHRILDPVTPNERLKVKEPDTEQPDQPQIKTLEMLGLKSGLKAKAIQTDEGFVVFQGSLAAIEAGSLHPGYRELRENLILNGTLKKTDSAYIFQRDTLFTAPSQAAAIINVYNTNGQLAWKDQSGRTLKEIESERMKPEKETP